MKFNFKIQQYQTDAVNSIINIFNGQPHHDKVKYVRDLGEVSQSSIQQLSLPTSELNSNEDAENFGYKNEVIKLNDDQLLANVRKIQELNNIRSSEKLVKQLDKYSFDIEMETGTGKTYVYIKTLFELNKRYGWSKFIIVVPSIAIREGVKKTFEVTQEHFMNHYGKKARFFIYNSSKLYQLDDFSSNQGINVMIINTQAFATSLKEGANNSDSRIIYSKRDEFNSRRPIDVIKANRPIIIMDEPQKMNGEVTQNALKNFDPLFFLNYSATHKRQHNLVYVLDALDAYNKRLVKKIEVKGIEVKNLRGIHGYLYLEDIIVSSKKPPMSKIEYEVKLNSGKIKRDRRILGVGENIFYLSNEMEQYKGYVITEIDPLLGKITFANGECILKGEGTGNIEELDMRRIQIRETIISHFQKEEKLFNLGIKTLSLFFIDEVSKYRLYDENGDALLGEYGLIFEEEYVNILKEYIAVTDNVSYRKYLTDIEVSSTHKGYFSIDKKSGHIINSKIKRGSDSSDDISAYDLILKNKERLLSFYEPTRFIFSHSALREGWDNPNVFQICTLKHSDSSTQKHQEVGRGLRLCVDQQGNRMDAESCGDNVHDINMLTVIASESYTEFVNDLQKQIKEVLYDRPSKATMDYFIGKTVLVGELKVKINESQAKGIYRYLLKNDYIDEEDNVTDKYKSDFNNNSLATLPSQLNEIGEEIHRLVQTLFNDNFISDIIDNGNEVKVQDNPLNENFYKKEFQTLWNHINHKYAYKVDFDSEELINKSIKYIEENLFVTEVQYAVSIGQQKEEISEGDIEEGNGFNLHKTKSQILKNAEVSLVKYDLVGKISEGTILTRKTIVSILKGLSECKLNMFKVNPEEFISKVIKLIKEQKATMIIEHITYNKIEGKYDSSIFTATKNSQDFKKAFKAQKHIQDYVFTDGFIEQSVERRFAQDLEYASEVCVYAKLPKGFSIPTPVGNYSPDWAIAFNEGAVKHIYFIAETKGTMESLDLRPIEKAKISCAKRLFNYISTENVKYHDVDSYRSLLNIMNSL